MFLLVTLHRAQSDFKSWKDSHHAFRTSAILANNMNTVDMGQALSERIVNCLGELNQQIQPDVILPMQVALASQGSAKRNPSLITATVDTDNANVALEKNADIKVLMWSLHQPTN